MIGKIRSRVSSAHLIGVVALVFAVGGSVALASVPKNSVNSNKVKNNTLKGVDVRNNSLTGADIRGLTGADINEASLNGAAIPGIVSPPAPPPGGATSISQRMAPNSSAAIAAGGFTIAQSTDAAGNCNVTDITAGQGGVYYENDITNDDEDTGNDIASGATETLDNFDSDETGVVGVVADDGSGGGTFNLTLDNIGGRCNIAFTAIGA